MTRRAYFLHRKCSKRVIQGQGGPSLRFQKLRHLVGQIAFFQDFEFVYRFSRHPDIRLSWNFNQKYFKTCSVDLRPQIYHSMQRARAQDHLSSASGDPTLRKKWWKNDRSRIDPKSFQDNPRTSRTSKNIKNNEFRSPEAPEEFPKFHPKTYQFEGFWDLNFSNFPCWRMCCLRRASRESFKYPTSITNDL